ncbi:MAG TPA: acyl-CoA dehydrogenase family protein [Actinomycetota bacterium]|jgi:alkylation response protein AidB-like acyl-CoA dehydrogenase|nr:acyl-CoA dehydrogenase family protein [Actinomycetota bacterium]
MLFALTEEQELLRKTVRSIAEERIAPRAGEIDRTGEFPWDVFEVLKRNDLLGLHVPETYGGSGADSISYSIYIEEIARVCASSSLIPGVNKLGSMPILIAGSEEQRTRYLGEVARGEAMVSYCLTEPESGSDAGAMKTTARRTGDGWVLNGTKRFITNAGISRYYIVYAKTNPDAGTRGISAFVVHADDPGFEVGKHEEKMGIRGSTTAEVIFTECAIPADRLIGEEGQGFKIAMQALDQTRLTIGAQAVGIAQGAYDFARGYAKERQQFGQPIAGFQAVQFMLADMAMRIEAARLLTYQASAMADARHPDLGLHSAYAKCFASDTAMSVTTDAVQVLGGYGYIGEYPVERMMRDAKITQIYEGTNQIQRVVIARKILS